MAGRAFAEEFSQRLLSSLVSRKGQNKGAVIIEDVDDLYQLISIWKEGQRVDLCKIPNSSVTSARQPLTEDLDTECVYLCWVRGCLRLASTIQPHWPCRALPAFPPSLLVLKGSDHYKQVLSSVLFALGRSRPVLRENYRILSPSVVCRRSSERGTLSETCKEGWRHCSDARGLAHTAYNVRLLLAFSCARPHGRLLLQPVAIVCSFVISTSQYLIPPKNTSHIVTSVRFPLFLLLPVLQNRPSCHRRMQNPAKQTAQEQQDVGYKPEEVESEAGTPKKGSKKKEEPDPWPDEGYRH